MLKKLVSLLLVVVMCISLVACGGQNSADAPESNNEGSVETPKAEESTSEEKVPLNVLFSLYTMPEGMMEALKEDFSAAFPNVELNLEVANNFSETITARFFTDDIPNIFVDDMIDYAWFDSGKLMDIEALASAPAYDSDGTVEESLQDGAFGFVTHNGVRYTAGFQTGYTALIINKSMFEEHGWAIPTSYEELLDVSKEIIAAGIKPASFGCVGDQHFLDRGFLQPAFYMHGGVELINKLGSMDPEAWGSDAVLKAFQQLKGAVDAGLIGIECLSMDSTQAQTAFCQGEYAMCFSGHWFESEMTDLIGDNEMILIPFPVYPANDPAKSVTGWYANVFIANSGDEKVDAAAIDFMRYMLSYEFQSKCLEMGWTTVSHAKAMEELAADPATGVFTKAVADILNDPECTMFYDYYQRDFYGPFLMNGFNDVINEVIAGETTPEDAVALCVKLAQQIQDDDTIVKVSH